MPRDLFRFDTPESVADWAAVDDVVMGGVSNSRLRHDPAGHAVFEGLVSLERNGGFASVRTRPMPLGVAGACHYRLEVRGDGRRYRLTLRSEDGADGPSHQAAFEPRVGVWTSLRLPLPAFLPTFRGREVRGAAPLDPARVRRIGLMIADRQAGRFALALRVIAVE